MLLLVYEYLTGGGLWSDETVDVSQHPLFGEGRSMVNAISDDLLQIADIQLVLLRDARCVSSVPLPHVSTREPSQLGSELKSVEAAAPLAPVASPASPSPTTRPVVHLVTVHSSADERQQLAHWSGRADGTILIAPESGGRLLRRCKLVADNGGRLLSPDPAFVLLATDKHATAQRLTACGVATPEAELITDIASFALPSCDPDRPWVLKPNDGVGSLDTYLCRSVEEWRALAERLAASDCRHWRLERYHGGLPVSVAALCGPRGAALLPPCLQRISQDGQFAYLGGSYPLSPELTRRACRLARHALAAMPATTGYVGIDMVLGEATGNTPDVVLDINPRLTTSYVGLRKATSSNLAHAMLSIARGQSHPLFFQPHGVEFDGQGLIA